MACHASAGGGHVGRGLSLSLSQAANEGDPIFVEEAGVLDLGEPRRNGRDLGEGEGVGDVGRVLSSKALVEDGAEVASRVIAELTAKPDRVARMRREQLGEFARVASREDDETGALAKAGEEPT